MTSRILFDRLWLAACPPTAYANVFNQSAAVVQSLEVDFAAIAAGRDENRSQSPCYIAVVKELADTGFERQLMPLLQTLQVCLL